MINKKENNICNRQQVERYLLNQMGEAEEDSFQQHLDRCDTCRDYADSIRALSGIIGDEEVVSVACVSPEKKEKKHFFLSRIWKWQSIAASILLLIGLSFYIGMQQGQRPDMRELIVQVPAGQRVELVLTDGTKVWLNAKTVLKFPNNFTGNSREVILDGEGYFDVTKDSNKPFIVKTEKYNVKVLGTEFNVTAYSGSSVFETDLLQGAVSIFSPGSDKSIQLEPNTRTYLKDGELVKDKIIHKNYFLWKDGLMSLHKESIESIIGKLQLYYDIKIIVENKKLLNRQYSGKFRLKDGVEHVLRVLQLSNDFTYEKNDELNQIIIK